MSAIPAFDLTAQHRALAGEIHAAVERVFASGRFILDKEVTMFEKEAAAFVGTREAVSCASGTDALHLALRAAGVSTGDEVITSAFSFIATAEAVLYTGATPVFADIDPATFTLSPASVEDAVSSKTRAIIAVHLYGHPADMDALSVIAKRHGLLVIEDCAQAFGARRNDRYAGAMSLAGCHSFFPTKNLGAYGDGGMITTDNADLAECVRRLRNHGGSDGTHHEVVGYNSRLDEVQAAILRAKLEHVTIFNQKRRRLAATYDVALKKRLQTPTCAAGCEHAYNQYTIRCGRRDAVAATLHKAGIGNRVYYPLPLTEQPSLKGVSRAIHCEHAAQAARECLSLPMFPELSEQDVARVATEVLAALD